RNSPIPAGTLIIGELGLTGEVRRVGNIERRIQDAINLGFTRFIVPESKIMINNPKVEIVKVKTLAQGLNAVFR
ncbi:MAG: DNA repair protein RadA, partial [Phascolarctobacterium sp.]|nr:DNA repair protein RadA [Phascolarctobacterium sp.]